MSVKFAFAACALLTIYACKKSPEVTVNRVLEHAGDYNCTVQYSFEGERRDSAGTTTIIYRDSIYALNLQVAAVGDSAISVFGYTLPYQITGQYFAGDTSINFSAGTQYYVSFYPTADSIYVSHLINTLNLQASNGNYIRTLERTRYAGKRRK